MERNKDGEVQKENVEKKRRQTWKVVGLWREHDSMSCMMFNKHRNRVYFQTLGVVGQYSIMDDYGYMWGASTGSCMRDPHSLHSYFPPTLVDDLYNDLWWCGG
jgi:hypothetical protein